MKDDVDVVKRTTIRIEAASKVAATKATKAAEMDEAAARMATKTKDALDVHVDQSALLIEQDAQDKADITARQDAQAETIAEQKHTIANLADALPVVARSIPPEEAT